MIKVKNLILGGGFAGLYLATQLDDAALIEQSDKNGGLVRGFETDSGFTFDVGGHVYTTKHDELSDILITAGATYHDKRLAYYDYERMITYPIQYNTERLGIDVVANSLDRYNSLEELIRHEFGDPFYAQVLGPFNRRVWTVDPSQLSTDWINGRIPLLKDKRPDWGSNSSFYYAKGKSIINVIQNRARINGVKWLMGNKVTMVDYARKIVVIDYNEEIKYDSLFDTTGIILPMLLQGGKPLPHNEVITIGVGLDRRLDLDFHWWYNAVDNESPIHRITLLSRYQDGLAPHGTDSLLLEIPRQSNDADIIEMLETRDLCAYGSIALLKQAKFPVSFNEHNVEEVAIIKSKGYPIPVIGHREVVAACRVAMLNHNAYLVGRWGAHGYYNLDHIIDDAKAAISVMNGNYARDYLWANYYYKESK